MLHLDFGLVWFGLVKLKATFNNISVISWWSVLLVEETRVPGESHRPVVAFRSDKYIFSNADYDDNCFSMNYGIVTTF